MNYFIGYNSALEYWRSGCAVRRPEFSRALPSAHRSLNSAKIDEAGFERMGIMSKPVHLIVADPSCRTESQSVRCHVLSKIPPLGSFTPVGKDTYSASPEFCFIEMAHKLSPVELAFLGYEFCGSYVPDDTDIRGFRSREAITSASSLRKHIDKSNGIRGVRNARRVLPYITDNAASPMEAILAMLFCLPCALGGYGVALPQLNARINLGSSKYAAERCKFYVCDMVWPEHRLVVEYDSTMFHSGEERICRDSKRRTDLIAEGYTVITVTKNQVFDAQALEKVAKVLLTRTGKILRKKSYNDMSRRYELRSALLGNISAIYH